ncbi:hypothetical protein AS594_35630 [Streptomyces agglomeratus]|uniref:Uncharacterized protein n=1 Tax=Streptomyces agglomeratus TaxID=285458 RepID=A0A1E5PHW1_9ACTN|nr:zinc ribbon domain-containing protein [Streptomyces agglomeratus]OEJ28964.1 hypothetical protein AS594_35630 [Streptomyces agglomeratus]
MGHFCAKCGYRYPDDAIEETTEERQCPQCGSKRVSAEAPAGLATVSATAYAPEIWVAARLWPRWASIAIDRALAARVAREQAVAATDPAAESSALNEEFDAALVAVAASAHTLDALYGSVVPATSRAQWRSNRTKRRTAVHEGLKLVFATGPRNAAWGDEFKWLFCLRDASVHHEEKPRKTVPHPSLGTHTGPEYAAYSTESADRAVRLMLDVLRRCVDHPRPQAPTTGPQAPTADRWAEDNEPVVTGLESRWASA